ncbi:hypothetical protein [Saezia sanguinis]|uniref:hypothetical protein n=1 Tax=Saezia sanguinis TaxID=1965230 RepID=UPI003043A0FC
MGWNVYSNTSKRALIAQVIARSETDTYIRQILKYCIRGNVLWSVEKCTYKVDTEYYQKGQEHNYIGCTLINGSGSEWGRKDMCESMWPGYYSCPLSYLDMVPVASEPWRAEVRKYHDSRKARQRQRRIRVPTLMRVCA